MDLIPAPSRTSAGYRAYDASVLDRLAFIRRAKRLGCSLDEIAGLVPDWEGGRCAPVQERLRDVVAAKLQETHARVAELAAFTDDLGRILAGLGAHTPDGPCDDDCGCLTDPAPPVACTLEHSELPGRLHEWRDVTACVVGRTTLDGGIRLQLDPATPLGPLAELLRAEQTCCPFFAFALTVDSRGPALEVRAPAEALALFG